MHYQNGRPAKVGDWVVGPTHNSSGHIVVGLVLELMERQGDCNVRLFVPASYDYEEEVGGSVVQFGKDRKPARVATKFEDYADAKRLVLCADGHRMLSAIEGHGKWDGPYL